MGTVRWGWRPESVYHPRISSAVNSEVPRMEGDAPANPPLSAGPFWAANGWRPAKAEIDVGGPPVWTLDA